MLPGFMKLLVAGNTFDEAGSTTYSTAATHTFTIPNYSTTLTITLYGSGAAGGSDGGPGSAPVSATTITSLSLSAGAGGGGSGGVGGVGGTASGGTTNTNGNAGNNTTTGGAGHDGYGGGGNGATNVVDGKGNPVPQGGGGGGAKVVKAYSVGALTPGATLSIVIPAAGAANNFSGNATNGTIGRAVLSWT